MGSRVNIKPYTMAQLEAMATPGAVAGGNMETYRAPYYDTQTYPAAGTDLLTFFAATVGDRSLSNMQGGGQFPDPQYHILWNILVDPILPLAAVVADPPTALADLHELLVVGRPFLTLSISDKPYGQIPLQMVHGSGGPRGNGFNIAGATVAAHEIVEHGPADGGFGLEGSLVIPPKVNFGLTIRWGNAQAVTTDIPIRVTLDTVEYRRIL